MRNKLIYTFTGLLVLLCVLACSEHDKYETSVVKQIELFLDDEGLAVNKIGRASCGERVSSPG